MKEFIGDLNFTSDSTTLSADTAAFVTSVNIDSKVYCKIDPIILLLYYSLKPFIVGNYSFLVDRGHVSTLFELFSL